MAESSLISNPTNTEASNQNRSKILIIDDEADIAETIQLKMRREGYSTFTADSAEEGMRLFRKVKPNLVIVDVMLPQRSGLEFCRAVRQDSQVPIIIISAKAEENDRVKGLEIGADDYVTKPFTLGELAARVKAVLRRAQGEAATEVIVRAGLTIDPKSHEVKMGDRRLDLSPKEFALLYFLAKNPGQVFSRDALLDRVWGKDAYVSSRTVDVHIRWLRTHIEEDAAAPRVLRTVRGVGYKFVG